MKKTKSILLCAFVALISLIVCFSVVSTNANTPTTELLPTPDNYNLDGTISHGFTPKQSKLNLANKGDPSLLQHSEVFNLIIFIYFQDEGPERNLFSPAIVDAIDENLNNSACSLQDYYHKLSYDEFTVSSVFWEKGNNAVFAYKAPEKRSYYQRVTSQSGNSRYSPESTLLNNAVAAANEYVSQNTDITEQMLDKNGDGFVDSVGFVVSKKYNTQAWGHLLWPHAWDLEVITQECNSQANPSSIGSKKVKYYTFTFAESFEIGLIAHEFGHLLGLPDYYHYDFDTDYLPVGYWDLMHLNCPAPQFMTSYSRDKYLHFLDKKQTPELKTSGEYSLMPTSLAGRNDIVAYKITINENEKIYLEYRMPNPPYDSFLKTAGVTPGLLIYRTNSSVSGCEEARHNNSRFPEELYVFRPDKSTDEKRQVKEKYNLSLAALTIAENAPKDSISSLGSTKITQRYDSHCIFLSSGMNTGIVVSVTAQTPEKITFSVDLGQYDCNDLSGSFVEGRDEKGNYVSGKHIMDYGDTPDIKVFLKYANRPSSIELSDFRVEYENRVCPEGQTAYAVFEDTTGEHKIPFNLIIRDVLKLEATVVVKPDKTILQTGENLSLKGLVIKISFTSGVTKKVLYDNTSPDDWEIIEGLDTTKHGRYDHVKIRYKQKIYTILSGVIVESELESIFLSEQNTQHLCLNENTLRTESFAVWGKFKDGTERKLFANEYNVSAQSNIPFEKTIVDIISKENETKTAKSFVYFIGDTTIESVSHKVMPPTLTFDYANRPTFETGILAVTFSNGKVIDLPTENYTAELLENFNFSLSGEQRLIAHVLRGKDKSAFSLTVNILPKRMDVLALKKENDKAKFVSINSTTRTIVTSEEMSLSDFASTLQTTLAISFADSKDNFELSLNAFGSRKVGANLVLNLYSQGQLAFSYKVILLGDSNGDGMLSTIDMFAWMDELYKNNPIVIVDRNINFDADKDGLYTINDFVLLLRKRRSNL